MSKPEFDYERIFNDMPAAYMSLDMDLRFIDMNKAYLREVQRTREELIGQYVFDAFPESGERREKIEAALKKTLAGEATELERTVYSLKLKNGKSVDIFWTCRHIPIFDKDGKQCGLVQRADNVTEEVKTERMRDVVMRELDHRIKNHLATISAIARRTAMVAQDTETFLGTFEQRIAAMSRTHQLLVNGQWDGLTLCDLVTSELEPFCNDDEQNVSIDGPDLMLTNAQAQSLGLAVHELTTNAAKYGALRDNDNGYLEVTWDADADERIIELHWRETGLSGIKEPVSSGFGTTILERILPAELNAKVTRKFRADGMSCTIILPLE